MRTGHWLRAALLLAAAFWLGAARAQAPLLELELSLDPASRAFSARAELTPSAAEFRFALHESLTPSAARAGGRGVQIVPGAQVGALREWGVRLPAHGLRLQIEYGGTLPALDAKLDHRGVLGGLPPMTSPAGSFLSSGAGWYPEPQELFRYRVNLNVPADQRALVAGHLLEETLPSDAAPRYRARFEFDHPADGIDLMAGPWRIQEKTVPREGPAPLRLRTYFPADLDALPGLAQGYLEDSARYIARYSKEIGPYPFGEFSVVASALPTGFGMPTLTYMGADVLKLPFIRATSLGHEVLHNWWGNGVYVDYARGNWCEGLTTFMADYAYKEDASSAAARETRLSWLRDFAAVPAEGHQALKDFRSRTHGAEAAVGYGKSAMVFYMLREAIGQEAFGRGIRAFWEKQRFRVAGWDDLRAAFEQASGRPLAGFFRQWVERPGGPQVAVAKATAVKTPAGARLSLEIAQRRPAYALTLPLQLLYGERAETRNIELGRGAAAAESQPPWDGTSSGQMRETVVLDLPALPEGLRIDPELKVWRVLEPEQLPPILRQWSNATAPRLHVASHSAELREAAAAVAARLLEAAPRPASAAELNSGADPVLLMGLHSDVDAALASAGLPPRPASLSGRGSAQVWTLQRDAGPPLAIVSAKDAESLRALQRPLPHYGGQSWLILEGSRVLERGTWPAPGRVVGIK